MRETGILETEPNIRPASDIDSLLTQPGSPSSLPFLHPHATPDMWTKHRTYRNMLELEPLSVLRSLRPSGIARVPTFASCHVPGWALCWAQGERSQLYLSPALKYSGTVRTTPGHTKWQDQ